jgi:glycerol-3-phosphate dehydrogenase
MSHYDVIVIGGGINGVGIACEASLQGFSTLLLEKDDVCSGVSAWSGRLAHGGLRYLEHYDFALVRESLLERERLIKNAPHLAKAVSWIMPVYEHNKRPGWLVRLGMIFFDILSYDKSSPRHKSLSKKETIARFPGISTEGLKGGFRYWDGQIELAERLCVEVALDAIASGAEIRTHSRVDSPILDGKKVTGVRYTDTRTGTTHEVSGSVIYNVAGPWIDRVFKESANIARQPRLNGGTKGSHLIVNPFPGAPKDVVYYETRTDGRLILVVPWFGKYLLGTTDIRWEEDPGTARCDIGELEYLINEVNALVPEANLSYDDVLYTYSGVRPLPYEPEKAESSVTRTHILFDHKTSGLEGLVTVVGGKLTTFRQLSEDAVTDIAKRLGRKIGKSQSRDRLLPGAHFHSIETLISQLQSEGASPAIARRLATMYGSRGRHIWAVSRGFTPARRDIDAELGLTRAEVEFVISQEFPKSLTDIMARRLILAFEDGHGRQVMNQIADIAAEYFNWSDQKIAEEIAEYEAWLNHLAIPDINGPRSESFGAKKLSKSA